MTTFAEVLRELGRGAVQTELSETLANLVQAVRDTQRAGSLTFVLKLKPLSPEALTTEVMINAKHPQPKRSNTVFFHTEDGSLMRDHPRQINFPELVEGDDAKTPAQEQSA